MKTSRTWMECLLPALSSEIPEARVFASFHIATEATLHSDEGHIEVIKSLHLTDKLVQAACSRNVWESRLGLFTLTLLGKDMPLTPHVPLWATEDVKRWLEHNKLGQLVELFESNRIDGELLLSLGEAELEQDLGITNKIVIRT
ncbi:unnamed protein product, partial [Dicrocoelium dendriticum]